jgi:3-(3-hydroxy-phenyl)propionate hydroxylase
MHRQPDDIWRIDYQLREDEDPEAEMDEARVRARVSAHLAMLGEAPDYDLIWTSVYRAHTLTLPRYRAGRVIFAGDAAHLVPIFGVRGLNSGIDDAGNLAWKLAAVLRGEGAEALLDSYSEERVFAARENIRQARKSTLFMTPPSRGFALLREAALSLAATQDFARALVNPRQTAAITFPASPLQTPDDATWDAGPVPGATLPDLKMPGGHLLDHLRVWPLLLVAPAEALPPLRPRLDMLRLDPATAAALGLGARGFYLVRPDGHVAARRHALDAAVFEAALARLMGRAP